MTTIKPDIPSRFKPGTVLGPEALSASEIGRVRALLALSGLKGVLVGVQSGHAAWDLRPLLLEKGLTSIVRFSNPALEQDARAWNAAASFLARLKGAASRTAVNACGQADKLIWIKRQYYKEVFITQPGWARFTSENARAALIKKLVGLLNDFKTLGLVHGHICSSNLSMSGDSASGLQPVFLDVGALFFDPTLPYFWARDPGRYGVEVAPENLEGAEPNDAADIYGLGLVLKAMHHEQPFSVSGSVDCVGLIDRMLSSQPSARPGLLDVVRALVPRGLLPEELSREMRGESAEGVRSGRIIDKPRLERKGQDALEPPFLEEKVVLPEAAELQVEPEGTVEEVVPAEIQARDMASDIPRAAGAGSDVSSSHLMKPLLVLALLVAVGLMLVQAFGGAPQPVPDRPEAEYTAEWASAQPSRMSRVAEVALKRPDSRARSVILKSAMSGEALPGVRANILRVAFDARWEGALTEADRRLALAMALQELLPAMPEGLPALNEAHPGVVLAIAGSIALGKSPASFREIPLDEMVVLPEPVGIAFALLFKQGLMTMAETPALALAHIIAGDVSEEAVLAYFSVPEGQEKQQEGRLVALAPFLGTVAGLDRQAYAALQKGTGSLRRLLLWFDEAGPVKWEAVPRGQLLGIITGFSSGRDLQFDHYVDLLRFPLLSVRSMAQRRLLETFVPESMISTISFLAGAQSRLNRLQNVSLVFALKTADSSGDPALISTWLKSQPDPQTVLGLLLARRNIEKDDVFNLEAARYLAVQDYDISLEQLKELAGHREALARALAISRLDSSKPDEAAILRDMAVVEPNERIRNQIKEKIGAK